MLRGLDQLAALDGRMEDVYDVGHELGKGAFSVVKHGRHRKTGENVALKIIAAATFEGNKRAQEAIRVEVEAMQRIRGQINNPSLIVMIGVFSDPCKVSIVLEELNGGELFDRIVARGRYTEGHASHLICTLAGALAQCHEKGIVHRDVKPENIMYTSRDDDTKIKLTDFGLALLYPGASVTVHDDNLVGTPGYVAPEVLSSRLYGPPCDVWACGVLLYILLAGYPPFYPSGDETLFEVIKEGKYYFHPDAWDLISAEAKDLVYRMLTVDVEKRATMADVLNHPWLTSACDHEYDHLSDTIHRLKAFNAKRKWRAVAAVVMLGARLGLKKRARSSSEEEREDKNGFSVLELETLKKAFLSSAEGGVLSRAQLASVFSDVGFGPVPSDRMFDLFDTDGNGTVDYGEFLAGMASFKHTGDKALRFCFDIYDLDGGGSINLQELKSVLSCVMRPQDVQAMSGGGGGGGVDGAGEDHDRKLSELFKRLDKDGNGTIDFEEFKAGAKREPLLVEAFLAPVQQGSLATTPAAVGRIQKGSGGPAAAGSRQAAVARSDAKNNAAGNSSPDAKQPKAGSREIAAVSEPVASGEEERSLRSAADQRDGGVDKGGDTLSGKRCRLEGSDCGGGTR
ncbi:unnamed protein product [Ectocarpus sp. 6 AP-2014]